jgi:prepilin-type N-terminal cleavage/methylation domain-containing protein
MVLVVVLRLRLLLFKIRNLLPMRKIRASLWSNNKGFTLIELVVAFSIMAILGTIGIASFVSYSRSQALQQATNELVTTVNTARAKAVAQVNDACSGGVLNGYDVVLTKGTNPYPDSYALNAICGGVDIQQKTTNFPAGVSLGGSNTIKISFAVMTGGVNSPPGNIIINGASGSKTLTIDSGGNILVPAP